MGVLVDCPMVRLFGVHVFSQSVGVFGVLLESFGSLGGLCGRRSALRLERASVGGGIGRQRPIQGGCAT